MNTGMQLIRLFLNVYMRGPENKWKKLIPLIKRLPGVQTIMIIEQSEPSLAMVEIGCDNSLLSVDILEGKLKEAGAKITEINIHFPSAITKVSDAYGASAVSITADENISKIKGVPGASISSTGIIMVTIDAEISKKQNTIDEIIKTIKSLK